MLALTEPRCWGHYYVMGAKGPLREVFCEKRQPCERRYRAAADTFDPDIPPTAVIQIADMLCGDDMTRPCFVPREAR